MDVIRLDATARTPGKGPARAARRNKEVPCILYGHTVEPVSFQVGELDLRPLIYTNEFHRVEVSVGDSKWDCILKKVDFHPVSDRPMHADFQVLQAGEVITLRVPIKYAGTPIGQREGGQIVEYTHELEVTCLPKDIPDHIELDVSGVEIGQSLSVSDLAFDKLSFAMSAETPLFAVQVPRAEEVEAEEEGLLEEGEAVEAAEEEEGGEE